jgi:hypothetical protein
MTCQSEPLSHYLRRRQPCAESGSMREDRRKARRFPVLEGHQQATLRVGDVSIPVRLVDQSATGFAIHVDEPPGVFPGEVVWLQTVAGWTEVRVVKARHEVDGTQIGLERIADLASGPQERGRLIPEQLAQENPRNNVWPLLVLVLGLASLLGFLAWTAVQRHMTDGLTAAVLPQAPEAAPDPRPAAVRAIEHEATRRAIELHKSIQQFGAAMLSLPEVVEHLKLSKAQQERLKQIVHAAGQEENKLRRSGKAGGDREAEEKVQQLRHAASEAAMQVLDEAQREQWKTMFEAALERLEAANPKPLNKP